MAVKGWWSKSRGLPPGAYESWASALAELPGGQSRILAWASTPDGFAVASPSVLSYPAAPDEGGDWHQLGWHEIERGGWDADTSRLGWVRYGGDRGEVALVEPGRLPEAFRERVAASIVLEESVPILDGRRQVMIVARRDLGDGNRPVSWHSTLGRGLSWQGPGVRAAVDEALARVRTEYDMG